MLGRLTILAVALVLTAPAQAQESLNGTWASDVNGEVNTISRKGGDYEMSFQGIAGSITPEAGGYRLNFKSGMFSSTDCSYDIAMLSRGERMIWRVTKGPDTCPRGAFSRLPNVSRDAALKLEKPVRPEPPPTSARPIRLDGLMGKWRANDGATMVVRKSFNGHEIWIGDTGQGTVVETQVGVLQAGFGNGQMCQFSAIQSEGVLNLDKIDGSCPFMGAYKKVQ